MNPSADTSPAMRMYWAGVVVMIALSDRKSTRLNSSHQSTRRLTLFPTRRSSDLIHDQRIVADDESQRRHQPRDADVLGGRRGDDRAFRSEEHTSELQSPIYTSIDTLSHTTLFRSDTRSADRSRR